MPIEKLTIFVDMDEVIADACGAFLERYNREFNESVTLAECHGKEVWEGIPEERRDVARKYHREDGFFRNLRPMVNSQRVLEELTQKYNVYIASAAMGLCKFRSKAQVGRLSAAPTTAKRFAILCASTQILACWERSVTGQGGASSCSLSSQAMRSTQRCTWARLSRFCFG